MRFLDLSDKVTIGILIGLLLLRMPVTWINNPYIGSQRLISPVLLVLFSLFLIMVAVIINQKRLYCLRVDKASFSLLFFLGFLLFLALPWFSFLQIVLVLFIVALFCFQAGRATEYAHTSKGLLLPMLVFILCLAPSYFLAFKINTISALLDGERWINILITVVPGSVVEEFIFRGLLVYFLEKLNWNTNKVIFFQGFLFWFSHINRMNESLVWFFVLLPIYSWFFGYISNKAKSIGPSSMVHILLNIPWAMKLV